jgi:hypothetical protein
VATEVIDVVAIVIAVALATAAIVLIVSVSRHRPQFDRRHGPASYRVRGRSIRGWQNSAIREIRRGGRQHGRRGR